MKINHVAVAAGLALIAGLTSAASAQSRTIYSNSFESRELGYNWSSNTYPIAVHGGETLRSPEGLALSSRNQYLSAEQKAQALQLRAALKGLIDEWQAGLRDRERMEGEALDRLAAAHVKTQIVRASDRALASTARRIGSRRRRIIAGIGRRVILTTLRRVVVRLIVLILIAPACEDRDAGDRGSGSECGGSIR